MLDRLTVPFVVSPDLEVPVALNTAGVAFPEPQDWPVATADDFSSGLFR